MELVVGITELQPQWSIVLGQIGVPYREININHPLNVEEYAAIIVSGAPTQQQKEFILRYLSAGGAILTEADYANKLLNIKPKQVTIKYLIPDPNGFFSNLPLCDLRIRSEVDTNAQYLACQNGVKTISIRNHQEGKMVILPSSFSTSLVEPKRIIRKGFPSLTQKFPSERVSQVSTGSIRHIIQRALIYLFHSRRLPFVQLWFFPKGEKNIFAFRVDTDAASQLQIEALHQICNDNKVSATWFVDTKSHEKWIDHFAQMGNQEIAYHCYNHRIYPDAYSNQLDIKKGLSILENIGIKPRGYAAPFGEWSFEIARSTEEKGFAYSSEFGCAYDDLPFFPWLGSDFSNTLQVPIHPISTRRLFLSKHDEEKMQEYYGQIIKQKLLLNDPIIFYHHPVHGHLKVFDNLFAEMNKRNIPSMNLLDFQSWWRKRLYTQWTCQYQNGNLLFNSSNGDSSIWVKAQYPDKRTLLMPMVDSKRQILLDSEAKPFTLNSEPKILRRYTLRMIWQEIESKYGRLQQ